MGMDVWLRTIKVGICVNVLYSVYSLQCSNINQSSYFFSYFLGIDTFVQTALTYTSECLTTAALIGLLSNSDTPASSQPQSLCNVHRVTHTAQKQFCSNVDSANKQKTMPSTFHAYTLATLNYPIEAYST